MQDNKNNEYEQILAYVHESVYQQVQIPHPPTATATVSYPSF